MPRHGILRVWNDDRGFGFIAPTDGGRELFVHISALPGDGTRPTVGERLTFEVGTGKDGKPQAVKVVRQALARTSRPAAPASPTRAPRRSFLPALIVGLMVIGAAMYAVSTFESQPSPQFRPGPESSAPAPAAAPPPAQAVVLPDTPPITADFRCDGRTHCSQMTSCAEAKFFLKNCPGTKMDGDRDGVPCEQQWCTSPLAK